jgi:3-phenylpropionate/trans-cinnamate dioxygenase ferredoxin component
MADFIEIGNTDELAEGKMKETSVQGQNILLAYSGGKYYATDNHCPHLGGNLSQGKLEGTIITCPRHQSQFDLRDGKVVRWLKGSGFLSAIGKAVKQPMNLKTYEMKIENGKIFVKI